MKLASITNMQIKTRAAIAAAVLLTALGLPSARATGITGDIELGGSVHLNTLFLTTATAVQQWVSDNNNIGFSSIQPGDTGQFAPIPLGTLVTMAQPWVFGLVTGGPQPALWSVAGFTFDLASSHVDFRSATSLTVSGTGTVTHAGFDPTPMSWTFTTQNATGHGGRLFSFSANAGSQGVPDGGATVSLLGATLGLLGMARRFIS